MTRSSYGLIGMLILLSSLCQGQELLENVRFRRLEVNNRLSNQNISAILQDSYGFLWVGTDDGLNRFDGYDFKSYRNDPNDTASLAQNKIQAIFEDSEGKLWVSTINTGLHYYDRVMDVFIRVPEWTRPDCKVMQIMEDEDKQLWIGGAADSYAIVARLDRKTMTWEKHPLMPSDYPFETMLPANGNIWVGMQQFKGLFRWNVKTKAFEEIISEVVGKNIEKIVKDHEDNMWIATRTGLVKYSARSKIFEKVYFYPDNVKSIENSVPILDLCLDGQFLWVGKERGGLSRIHLQSGAVSNFNYVEDDDFSIGSNSIWSLHRDKQGRIWIGSFDAGLSVLDKLDQRFHVFTPYQNESVNALVEDTWGKIWIGTEDGAIIHDKESKQRFRFDINNTTSIGSNAVLCFFEDSKRQMWIGCWDGGLNRFNRTTNSFTRFMSDPLSRPGSLTNPNVFSISENSDTGELLVGTFGGLNILKDETKQEFDYLFYDTKEGDVLITSILKDSKKNIWVGAYSGANLYDLKGKRIRKIPLIVGDSSLTSYRVNCFFETSQGDLWIGSHGGLHKVVNYEIVQTYNTASGLPSDIVQSISEDNNHNLWIGTTKGLVKFNPEKNTFRVYNETDGLLSDNIKAILRNKKGIFYVGGKGINVFNPDSLIDNSHKPEVYITGLKLFNKTVTPNDETKLLKSSVQSTDVITLSHTQNFITLQFIGIDFSASYKNKYAYKLTNFDNDWNYIGDKREVTFTNLLPGTYFFQVKACNNDGLWNEEGKTLKIIVLPPWWATIWFRALAFLFLASGVIAFYYFRIRSINIQKNRLEQLVEDRTRELRSAQEETNAQRDQLAEQNKQLENARKEIEQKNLEIMMKNKTLEEEVDNRTKELWSNIQQLEQFAFIAAHNLRAPVARILGLGEVLKYSQTSEQAADAQYRMVKSALELDSIVRDLNHVLEIRTNSTAPFSTVIFSEEMKLVRNILQSEIESSGAVIKEDFRVVNEVQTVKPYFESILTALISNALKFRDPDRVPEILVQSSIHSDFVNLSIRDNGLGLDVTQNKEKLLKFYSRFHSNVSSKGVGLFIVKTLLEILGGKIEFIPNETQGLTVIVSLPK